MKKFVGLLLIGVLTLPVLGQSRFEDEKEENENKSAQTQQATDNNKPKPAPQRNTSFWDRTRFGGNLGLGFSSSFSYVNLSPRMFYLASEKLWLGAGLTFIWSQTDFYPPPLDEQFVYGVNLSAQYMLFGPLFIQAEYEPLSFERATFNPSTGELSNEERVWVNGLLLGGGIAQPMGRGMFFASVLYNVTWRDDFNSYYASPWVFRLGFGI
jgi:hypothetical protein